MKKYLCALVLSSMGCALFGCAGETAGESDGDEEETSEASSALTASNALAPNALAPNALAPNALAPNALAPNALAPNALPPARLSSLQTTGLDGEAARQLVKYTVSCALTPQQTFSFVWTDAAGVPHVELYTGLLGLAPAWATGPLTDETAQRLVSACLAARVNRTGTAVVISMRSQKEPLRSNTSGAELLLFNRVEGAFWGNVFTEKPYLNGCYVAENADHSRAASRECATGHLEDDGSASPCGMIAIAGPCSSVCTNLNGSGKYYTSCLDHPEGSDGNSNNAVITTALP